MLRVEHGLVVLNLVVVVYIYSQGYAGNVNDLEMVGMVSIAALCIVNIMYLAYITITLRTLIVVFHLVSALNSFNV